jgi:ABC-2 type transport system permease protein
VIARRFPVFAQGLRDRRRSLVWWSVGVATYIAVIAAMWPSIRGAAGLSDIMNQLPKPILDLMGASEYDISTGAGYVSGELFGFMIPIFILILTIGTGAAAIGGAEERGMLDLLLSHPISRRRVVLQSAALVAVEALLFGVVIVVTLAIATPFADLQIAFINAVGAASGIVLLGIAVGWTALAVGAATGSRSISLAATGSAAAITYLLGSLSGLVAFLHNAKWISPFVYANDGSPLEHGYTWWHGLVLAGFGAGVVLVGAMLFDRRNLSN